MAPPVAGYVAWYDASQIAQADNTALSTWSDLSGNGHHLNSGTAPRFYSSTAGKPVNGLPAVWFTAASSQYLVTTDTFSPVGAGGTWSAFAVGYTTSTGATQMAVTCDSSNRIAHFLRQNASNQMESVEITGTPVTAAAGTMSAAAAGLMGAVCTTTTLTARFNGTPGTGQTVSSPKTGNGPITLGTYVTGLSSFWNGPICEVVLYPSALNPTDTASTETYLTNRWLVAAPYYPAAARRSFVPIARASNWRGWTKRLSGLTVPGFSDARLNILGA